MKPRQGTAASRLFRAPSQADDESEAKLAQNLWPAGVAPVVRPAAFSALRAKSDATRSEFMTLKDGDGGGRGGRAGADGAGLAFGCVPASWVPCLAEQPKPTKFAEAKAKCPDSPRHSAAARDRRHSGNPKDPDSD